MNTSEANLWDTNAGRKHGDESGNGSGTSQFPCYIGKIQHLVRWPRGRYCLEAGTGFGVKEAGDLIKLPLVRAILQAE
jgi:hypothetical protein